MSSKFYAENDSFYIENYNSAPPFASFLPALAGVTGKPMWVFYSNRGQGVASFGINNKDGAMLEFLPANKAFQSISVLGFRTFLKFGGKTPSLYEPFAMNHGASSAHQTMIIRPHEFGLLEKNSRYGVEVSVAYFGVPNEDVPVLARRLSIRNMTGHSISLQLVDGLPRVVPHGMDDYLVKNMSRTIEAFAHVENVKMKVPFFKLKIEPQDRPDIRWMKAGYFAFGMEENSLLNAIVDPTYVFGSDTSFIHPHGYSANGAAPKDQITSCLMPSCFFQNNVVLKPHETKHLDSYFGHAGTLEEATGFADRVRAVPDYFETKREEMAGLVKDLVRHFGLRTADPHVNAYAATSFMDNVLRGGYPLSLGTAGPIVHVFSRKHGDMERDYNAFQVSATYYSQGNGNFRDVNQNRRSDVFLNPDVGTTNVEFFFNLLQLDGYNPLVINPVKFVVPVNLLHRLELKVTDECKADFSALRQEPVLVGHLYEFVKKYAPDPLNVSQLFEEIISVCEAQYSVQHGEGYWVDHWTYNLDHLENYLAVFPEKKTWLFFEKDEFTFYDSDHFVRPRRDKYVVTLEGKLRQYNAVISVKEKKELIASRSTGANKVRADNGKGAIVKTTLIAKLLSLVAIKTSSLDPFGVGIEMDADKPGWCDALNGLPGLFGSSTHETTELHRLVIFLLKDVLPASPTKNLDLPQEIVVLVRDVEDALSIKAADFRPIWDKLATARENFRERTFYGLSGKTRACRRDDIEKFLRKVDAVLQQAEKKAIDPKNQLPTSYFRYEVNVKDLDDGWRQHLAQLPWKQHRLPPFLEGAVHAFKLANPAKSKKLYQAVRRSELYDRKLRMYKLNVPLGEGSMELGRIQAFPPGWLENESVFLHMHYKFLLELLRSGLIDSFFKEMRDGLIPYRDPKIYGRSNLENSSFLVSSAFENTRLHGKGFVARLSGATSEFISMVYLMTFGRHPFRSVEGGVVFSPQPTLPREWFSKKDVPGEPKNSLTLRLFDVPVTYVNPHRKSLSGSNAGKPVEFEWILDGRFHRHKGRHLTVEASQALREGRLESLTVFID